MLTNDFWKHLLVFLIVTEYYNHLLEIVLLNFYKILFKIREYKTQLTKVNLFDEYI
jgi:hypothetical protein